MYGTNHMTEGKTTVILSMPLMVVAVDGEALFHRETLTADSHLRILFSYAIHPLALVVHVLAYFELDYVSQQLTRLPRDFLDYAFPRRLMQKYIL